MEQQNSTQPDTDMMPEMETIHVHSPDELRAVLGDYGVNTRRWEHPPFKSVERLFEEIETGESRLVSMSSQVGRLVSVACVDVYAQIGSYRHRLIEDRQEFRSGGVRRRGIYGVSEKIQRHEVPEVAARRGLKEELGVEYTKPLVSRGYEFVTKQAPYGSYPGLLSMYATHRFYAEFGIDEYNPEGYAEQQIDKVTYFVWQADLEDPA